MIQLEKDGSIIKISFLKADMDIGDTSDLEKTIMKIQFEEYNKLQLELSKLRFMNSTSIGQFARILQDAKHKNAEIISIGTVDPFIRQLLTISGLETFISFTEK